ncbi:DEAD/DEAH box helicase [Ideonella sp. YS5]|uniref:DEAD/DEAH box helicase n=1 Tax=Ideonella sp. YS5 TaxID=3453714 RepID=UPI003EEC588C
MALFPQGLTNVDRRCTPGERNVLHQLKRCLGDDHVVWHDVPIGPRARQPDFVVLGPRQGLLLLEVKDWKLSTLAKANPDAVELNTPRGLVTVANPLRQARDYAAEMADVMAADPLLVHGGGPFRGKLLFAWGWGVVFARMREKELAGTDFRELFPSHRCLVQDDLDDEVEPADFAARLWGMFNVSFPYTLTLPQRDRIRWHLFPELRVSTQASLGFDEGAPSAAPALPDLLQVMDLQQEQIARTLGEGHRVIHGAAGSGKTMILVYRAQHLAAAARPDRPVLVLCYNRALADRIEAQLRDRGIDERVQVRTFHGWCSDVIDSYQLDVPWVPDKPARYRLMAETTERALHTGFVPGGQYTALLVDEAHDFEDAWLRMAVKLVDPATNSLLVLFDDAQSIYQRKRRRQFTLSSVGIQAQGRTSILKIDYRNTAEVLAVAVQCAQGLLAGGSETMDDEGAIPLVQPATAGRRGPMPVFVQGRNEHEEAELIAERIEVACQGGRSLSEVAVLCRAKYQMRPIEQALRRRHMACQSMGSQRVGGFAWREQSVKLLTLHSAKGLEFPLVFIAGLQAMPMKDESPEEAARLLYVGMTRATHELVLSAHGDSPLVRRVAAALQEVQGQFSAAA